MPESPYSRSLTGMLFDFMGINTQFPLDALPQGKYAFGQNIRNYQRGRVGSRVTLGAPTVTIPGSLPVNTIARLNDSTPNGPAAGYSLVVAASTSLFSNATKVNTGLSGNTVAMVPFIPNTSVQPWMYVGDSNVMSKVRSDGTCYKMGIKEPQIAPVVGTQNTTATGTLTVLATATPWSPSLNPDYSFTIVGSGSTGPAIIAPGILQANATLKITAAATTIHIGGGVTAVNAGTTGSKASGYPGAFITNGGGAKILMGAFTDDTGAIVAQVSPTDLDIVEVGTSATLLVPTNATQFQLGIDDDHFTGNTGSIAVSWTVTASAVATQVSILGQMTCYYWGDSPHSGPVSLYIWQSVDDGYGSGPTRSTSNASGSILNNSLIFDLTPSDGTEPMLWSVFGSGGEITGTVDVFTPALESEGYQDFNLCVTGSLFIPSGGTYTFTLNSFNDALWGFGNNATWSGKGTITGSSGQTITVLSNLPLLPVTRVNSGNGIAATQTVSVTFPAQGVYAFEVDFDYWDHSGRTLVITCNGENIIPLPSTVKQDVQYEYVYRSSATGATSNPSPPSILQTVPVNANTILATYSPDPQVDKIDFYRIDSSLDNYTYVLTTQNTNPPTMVTDTLLDTDVAANPILQLDNFEPFPVIDLPHRGYVTVVGSIVEWSSGDQFNVRWLPGTIINIGGIAYVLTARPTSATTLLAGDVPSSSTPLVYEIDAPTLAAQPMASMWGPTPSGFAFAVGDPLNPGKFYWSKGNNLDAAPDTNQQDLTSPSEPLINGCIANGQSVIFSSERAWIIYPTFTSASATVTGTLGSTWNPVNSILTRGLFLRNCLAVDGSGNIYFRSKDGISVSPGGQGEQSITDDDLYGLFRHEGNTPLYPSVNIGGFMIVCPYNSYPELHRFTVANGYLYYDYPDSAQAIHTLVYDIEHKAWVVDQYGFPVTVHCDQTGPNVNTALVGCSDGTIRSFISPGTETVAPCVLATPAVNGGDTRGQMKLGDIYVRASIQNATSVEVSAWTNRYQTQLGGLVETVLHGTGKSQEYIVDYTSGDVIIDDIELIFQWNLGSTTLLELWQPTWITQPEFTQNRASDWDDGGTPGLKFIQGLMLEADTNNMPKSFQLFSSDDQLYYAPDQSPVTFNGQSIQALTFTPPFLSHSVRRTSSDNVPWRVYHQQLIFQPYPELVAEYQTEYTSHGNEGWQSIREMNLSYLSTTALTVTLNFDQWPSITLLFPTSNGLQLKQKLNVPVNKFKLVSYRVSSTVAFRLFQDQCEVKLGMWGRTTPFRIVNPFGGAAGEAASV